MRRWLLGFSLCLVNIVLVFVKVTSLTEFSIYLAASAIGILILATDKRQKMKTAAQFNSAE